MFIEDNVFSRKRFVADAMIRFGFVKTEDGYRYETGFMNGDFSAILLVSENGTVTGTVIDRMNGEEYAPLRIDGFEGEYVNSVRFSYEELLRGIAAECCTDALFSSEQANRIVGRIAAEFGVEPDFPWGKEEDCGVFRHLDHPKWFALMMNVKRHAVQKNGDGHTVDVVNLKSDPDKLERLCERRGIYPAYHMNHKHWITVLLDDSLPDDDVMALIRRSFELTEK